MKNMQEVLTAKMAAAADPGPRRRVGAGDDLHERAQPGPELVKRCLPSSVRGCRLVALEEPEDLAALQHDGDVAVDQFLAVSAPGDCSAPQAMSASSRAK